MNNMKQLQQMRGEFAANAFADPSGNIAATTVPEAITEVGETAEDILAQIDAMDASTDTKYSFTAFFALTQAMLRSYESRITTLEAQVAALS